MSAACERPPLLALHGFTGAPADFAGLGEALGAPRTLAPFLPGHGPDASGTTSSMATAVASLIALLDAERVPQVDLLGYSLGGRTALALLAVAPERVRRAVIVGAGAGIVDEAERAARRANDAALADRVEQIGVPAFVAEWQATPLIATQRSIAPALRAQMDAARQQHTAAGLAASLRGMGQGSAPALHGALRTIAVPVLCVAGEHDLRYRAAAAELAQLLPAGRIVVVPGAGHAAHLEAPATFAALVAPFLAD